MVSDEENIISRMKQSVRFLEARDFEKHNTIVTEDVVLAISNYPVIRGKKEILNQLYGLGTREMVEKIVLRSPKIQVSENGDMANAWSLEDSYIDGELIATHLILSGWIKRSEIWYLQSVMGTEVEKGWSW